MKRQLTTISFLFATVVTVAIGGQAYAQTTASGSDSGSGYTVLDHPSEPCRLSVEAVANWGETSAHLPQACTYGEKR